MRRSASKDMELETTYAMHIKESSAHEKAISRDLGRQATSSTSLRLLLNPPCRTFPHHEYFMDGAGVGQENLFNVLKAYSL